MNSLEVKEVTEWLRKDEVMTQFSKKFEENKVDGLALNALTKEDLILFGMVKFGHRKRFFVLLEELRQKKKRKREEYESQNNGDHPPKKRKLNEPSDTLNDSNAKVVSPGKVKEKKEKRMKKYKPTFKLSFESYDELDDSIPPTPAEKDLQKILDFSLVDFTKFECTLCHKKRKEDFKHEISCGHAFCRGCFIDFVQKYLESNKLGLKCPFPSCNHDIFQGDVEFILPYEKMKTFKEKQSEKDFQFALSLQNNNNSEAEVILVKPNNKNELSLLDDDMKLALKLHNEENIKEMKRRKELEKELNEIKLNDEVISNPWNKNIEKLILFCSENTSTINHGEKQIYQLKQMIERLIGFGVKVENIMKDNLSKRFLKCFQEMRNSNPEVRLSFAYHGTSLENYDKIVQFGLKVPDGKNVKHRTDSGWYGRGIYFSPDPSISSGYLSNGNKLLCCAVIQGKVFVCHDLITGSGVKNGYDSHVSGDGSEIVIFKNEATLPLFAISYQDYFNKGTPRTLEAYSNVPIFETKNYSRNGNGNMNWEM